MSDANVQAGTTLLDLLGQLLEAERAGARGVGIMSRQAQNARARAALTDIARDEARFCAMLTRHITRLGGVPSTATGAFFDKLMAIEDPAQRLDFLDRGQGWVARKLREAPPESPTRRCAPTSRTCSKPTTATSPAAQSCGEARLRFISSTAGTGRPGSRRQCRQVRAQARSPRRRER
jgi:hypothetical protein